MSPCSDPYVLVVDDDPDIREVMTMVLEGVGYRVATAANGSEALDHIRKKALPCLILLDLMMPVMNGWQFRAEQIRDERLATVPVVILTGAGYAAQKAAALGAAASLDKPVALQSMLALVHRYCAAQMS